MIYLSLLVRVRSGLASRTEGAGARKMAKKAKWTREGLRALSPGDKPASFAVQFYDENCTEGWEAVLQVIKDTDPEDLQIIAICHDRDGSAAEGGTWQPSSAKRHFHIVVRGGEPSVKPRVGATLRRLGITFRSGEDDWMKGAHGIEVIGKLPAYIAFLLHKTSYLGDGDAQYGASELVSNLPEEKLEAICGLAMGGSAGELDVETVDRLRGEARDLGREFGNFDEWYDELPFDHDQKAKKMKDLRKCYDLGVRDRCGEDEEVVRLSVFITGQHGDGKSTAAAVAVDAPNGSILRIGGSGRGRFDNLRPWTQAIIVDDDVSPGLLNLTDNRIMSPYSRGSNHLWTGAYFIATSNLSFDKWAVKCGVDIDQLAAARDRFYICAVIGEGRDRHLGLESESHRGSEQVERERLAMFLDFQERFNRALSSYDPAASIDYESYKDPAFRETGTQQKIDSPAFWEQVARFAVLFWEESDMQDEPYDRKIEYLGQLTDDEIKSVADKAGFRHVAQVFAKEALLRGVLDEYVREYDPEDYDFEPGLPPEEEGSE